MSLTTHLTFILCLISFAPERIHTDSCDETTNHSSQRCTLVELEDHYYALFIENRDDNPTHFFGVCDLETLTKWHPCPFLSSEGLCAPIPCRVNRQLCDVHHIATSQPRCNCTNSLKARQLEPIPDFPTCLMGGQRLNSNCSAAAHRSARRAPAVIYNCVRCMAKHPDGLFSAEGRRVKRSEITPVPVIRKRSRLLDCHHPRTGNCSLTRKYRRYVPADVKNKRLHIRKLPYKDIELERTSNTELTRILRTISARRRRRRSQYKKLKRGPKDDEEIEDDDEDEDEDIGGEDVAIEEDEDEEKAVPTTDAPEKDEVRKQQVEGFFKKHNLSDDEVLNKAEGQEVPKKQSSGLQRIPKNSVILLMCTLLFWF